MCVVISVIISIENIFPKIFIQTNDEIEMNNMYDIMFFTKNFWFFNGTLFMDVLNKIDEKYSTLTGHTAVWSLLLEFPIILYDFSRQEYLKIGNFSMVPFPKKGEIYISESVAKLFNVFF
jgi:hypothetical protein